MITSSANPRIRRVRGLLEKRRQREEEQAFVAEGVRLVEEGLSSGLQAELVLYCSQLSERGKAAVQRFAGQGADVEEVTESLIQSLSGTETSQGLLAVFPRRDLPLPFALTFLLIADRISDPGNLGTLLRTAAAAGVQAALLSPGTTDPFAPKALRSGMGAHFRLPVLERDWSAIRDLCKRQDPPLFVYCSDVERGVPYWKADMRRPLALVVGSEADGTGPEVAAFSDGVLTIPMPGRSESLNAAVAAGILMFEVVRQRQV